MNREHLDQSHNDRACVKIPFELHSSSNLEAHVVARTIGMLLMRYRQCRKIEAIIQGDCSAENTAKPH
jgi:hypothetical protein